MAQRLKRRGLVAGQQEIVDRIGHARNGQDPTHLDDIPLWVLVVSGPRSQPPHVSLHTRRSGAERTPSGVVTQHLADGGSTVDLGITLVPPHPTTR
ncbi:hypothetical protein K8O92_20240 [Nocardia asteroides]|nr:hypothetical protein K8O92_20240 [Nocardia asteroides]